MGLDMYAYAAHKAGAQDDFYEAEYGDDSRKGSVEQPREIAYWRKHPNLHGWMRDCWARKVRPEDDPMFNGVELELTWEDLDELEEAVESGTLPATQGFFFGSDADEYYKEQDLEFIRKARSEIFCGLRVFYNSSW